jgi:hypothetical protein
LLKSRRRANHVETCCGWQRKEIASRISEVTTTARGIESDDKKSKLGSKLKKRLGLRRKSVGRQRKRSGEEEAKALKKQKEKERIEQQKREGTYLTKAQRGKSFETR